MVKRDIHIVCTGEHGLHLRPAKAIMAVALLYAVKESTLEARGKSASVISAIELMSLEVRYGDVVVLHIVADDEAQADQLEDAVTWALSDEERLNRDHEGIPWTTLTKV